MGEPATARTSSRNHAAWIGPLIAVPGFFSYFVFFSHYPIFRDVPWLNLLILAGAIALGVVAVRRSNTGLGRTGSAAGLGLSVLLTGALSFYCFVLSYGLPDAGRVADDGTRIPAITLASSDGSQINVGAAAQENLILVFYRGYW